ncbi:MAG: hypothetical protein KH216_02785 [Clostridiales bacterium]|nr:hypothetical protein [Clostridiales bacterium]
MDLTKFMANKDEKPLDNIAINGGFTSIFRTIGCIGDSLSSGELEAFEAGLKSYHDYFEYSWGQFSKALRTKKTYSIPTSDVKLT